MFDTVPYEPSHDGPVAVAESRVFFYGLSFCDHCAQGRKLLEESGIQFSWTHLDRLEPDVRRPVLRAFRDVYGKPVIYPVLEIDGEYTFGYNQAIWSDLIGSISQ
jgi:glutaredoxin